MGVPSTTEATSGALETLILSLSKDEDFGPAALPLEGAMTTAQPTRLTALIAVNASAVIFGASGLFGKIDASPVWITFGRAAFAALALWALALALRTPLRLTRRQLAGVTVTAALLALHWIGFFVTVKWAGVAVAALTVSTFPLVTILIQAARLRRPPALIELAAGVAIILAVALITGPGAQPGPRFHAGVAVGLGAAALFAVYALITQQLQKPLGALALSLHQNTAITLMLAPMAVLTPGPTTAAGWGWLVVLGVIGTAMAHQLYFTGLKRLSAAACGAAASMEPVYAIAFAAILFAEPMRPAVFASAALIIGASLLLMRRPHVDKVV
jgi:drug/metabolite transporter (DMT)-like permease